ncbi:MAG: OmpA family protein [Micavibrio sp.]|nr:OmpA family protein [Micavibrio sp.]
MSDDWLDTGFEDEYMPQMPVKEDTEDVKFDSTDGSAYKLRKQDGGTEEEAAALWLITFTDAMALMLTFFVLLYSMSAPAEEKWEKMTDGLYRNFEKKQKQPFSKSSVDSIDISKIDYGEALDLGYLSNIIRENISRRDALGDVLIYPQDNQLLISMPQNLLFNAGNSDVSDEGKQALFVIGGALVNIRNRIEVIGHADPRPFDRSADGAKSNWSLSLDRANKVADILKNVGYERPITARGLSSSRYSELPENWSKDRRESVARRVDIMIMQDDGREFTY